jgi:hypothetical protein
LKVQFLNKRPFLLGFFAFLFILVAAELLLRQHSWTRFKLADKKLHCLRENRISLCPDISLRFEHPFGFSYNVTTDHQGNRITTTEHKNPPVIHIFGDSIAMGYGMSDDETFPWRLSDKTGRTVINHAVDAVGAEGVYHQFESALKQDQVETAFWIFHPSDFQDDEKPSRPWLTKAISFAGNSAIYNYLRFLMEEKKLIERKNAYFQHIGSPVSQEIPEKSRITYKWIEKIVQLAIARNSKLYILFHPNIDMATGLPSHEYATEQAVADFVREKGGHVIDVRSAFLMDGEGLYLPVDGHPSAKASRLFADAALQALTEKVR